MTRVLIADDDNVVRDVVRRYLERDGLDVLVARDGNQALRMLGAEQIDVAVLDVMMPGPDGLALCRVLRERGGYAVPVILLTALGEEDDRIAGLEAGADDYLIKPMSIMELTARLGAPRRRLGGAPSDDQLPVLRFGGIEVVPDAGRCGIGGEPVALTRTGFRLLCELAEHTGANC